MPVRLHFYFVLLLPTVIVTTRTSAQTVSPEAALVRLAREAVRAEVLGTPLPRPEESSSPSPVFVTIERSGKVIGCRGDLECRARSLEEEIRRAARGAAAHDPRYRPLRKADLVDFLVTVTVVREQVPLEGPEGIDGLSPADGLVLRSGSRTGVVLPWEGKDPQVRLRWAYAKAGVPPGSSCRLFRLIAERVRG
jgi:AMMECR1 domain-containing protein